MEPSVMARKGSGLPVPVSSQKDWAVYAGPTTSEPARHRKHFKFLVAFALAVLLGSTAFSLGDKSPKKTRSSPPYPWRNSDLAGNLTDKEAEDKFLKVPNGASANETSKLFASEPHIAGSVQDFITAVSFLNILQEEFGITPPDEQPIFDAGSPESRDATLGILNRNEPYAWIDKYYPVMDRPLDRALEIVDDQGVIVWKANVEEPNEPSDSAGDYGVWHGFSASGSVTGHVVYVDYGRKEDFDTLAEVGASLKGTIAVARYGGTFRGVKVKLAEEAGCIGILIYSDPRDSGNVTEEAGYKPFPDGPALNPDSVQRGSVLYMMTYPGDPTTPGYPSYPNATRHEARNLPSIPSLPISWANGKRILDEISPSYPYVLDGTLSKRRIHLLNQSNKGVLPIWNTVGVIPGQIKDEIVILGNHRDAWVYGAADPSSGTATLVEVIKGFGALLQDGWIPRRTIVFASWDGEEYGIIGSTEYGEDFANFLASHVVAYLNVDISNSGSKLVLGGSPSLAHLARGAAQSIPHPTDQNRTLWDARNDVGPYTLPHGFNIKAEANLRGTKDLRANANADDEGILDPLGSGSDYTVFLQRIGIASIDGGFDGTASDAVYHYHSIYDSRDWLLRFSDPEFAKHVAVAKYLGLVALRIADPVILPINTTQYSIELGIYLSKVEELAEKQGLEPDLSSLREAISDVYNASIHLDHEKEEAEKALREALLEAEKKVSRGGHCIHWGAFLKQRLNSLKNFVNRVFGLHSSLNGQHAVEVHTPGGDEGPPDPIMLKGDLPREVRDAVEYVCRINAKLAGFERGFIDDDGLTGREWYRHLGVAPGKWLGYGATTFPAVTEALEDKNVTLANAEAKRLANLLEKLAEFLNN